MCDRSLMSRKRECSNPKPSPYGQQCNGSRSDIISCDTCQTASSSNIRLVNGRVEVYLNGAWGTVCPGVFSDAYNVVQVVCRMLGLPASNARYMHMAMFKSMPVLLDGVICNGNEASLFDCSLDPGCQHHNHREFKLNDFGVYCE
ncbi:hypothetical protein DPMN_137369 [Dreissena polymorpha]|nr:hypothetical protein DPMN_137369 [Dreissena polymorpha]